MTTSKEDPQAEGAGENRADTRFGQLPRSIRDIPFAEGSETPEGGTVPKKKRPKAKTAKAETPEGGDESDGSDDEAADKGAEVKVKPAPKAKPAPKLKRLSSKG